MNKIIVKEQSKLVNTLIGIGEIKYDDIENLYDEVEEEYHNVYFWYLIKDKYSKVFEDLKIPVIHYDGLTWIGQTWYGASWRHSGYWEDLCKKLPFLKNE